MDERIKINLWAANIACPGDYWGIDGEEIGTIGLCGVEYVTFDIYPDTPKGQINRERVVTALSKQGIFINPTIREIVAVAHTEMTDI